MKYIGYTLCICACISILTACGFHLRGLGSMERPLPFNSLYLDGGSSNIGSQLRQVLQHDPRLQVLDVPQHAEAIVTVLNENQSKDVLSTNIGGKINEYQLIYTATVRVVLFGHLITPDIIVTIRRTLSYSDSAVLGKEQEEGLLWQDARRDAADQIVRRLAYLKRPQQAQPSAVKADAPNR